MYQRHLGIGVIPAIDKFRLDLVNFAASDSAKRKLSGGNQTT